MGESLDGRAELDLRPVGLDGGGHGGDFSQVRGPVLSGPVYRRVPPRHPSRQHGEPGQHGHPGGTAHVRGLGYQPVLDTGVLGAALHVAVGTLLLRGAVALPEAVRGVAVDPGQGQLVPGATSPLALQNINL